MFQLPLLNLSQNAAATDFSTYRNDVSRQSTGTRGILKISAPSLSNLMTTFDSNNTTNATNPRLTVFPMIQLTQSDRTVLSNLEKSKNKNVFFSNFFNKMFFCFNLNFSSILSRDDPTNVISHCRFLSNVVFNDFPAELFLQRSFILKRLLALLNENNDELVEASVASLKNYAVHLQRRIKILRDPSCFCPNLQFENHDVVHDEFNNTMNSARSVSSINSATSNGYRNPSQWFRRKISFRFEFFSFYF